MVFDLPAARHLRSSGSSLCFQIKIHWLFRLTRIATCRCKTADLAPVPGGQQCRKNRTLEYKNSQNRIKKNTV